MQILKERKNKDPCSLTKVLPIKVELVGDGMVSLINIK
jgi:hypothetical protein